MSDPVTVLPAYGTPPAARRPVLGRVALIAGVALFVASVATSVLVGIAAAPYVEVGPTGFDAMFSFADPNPAVRALAAVMLAHVVLGGLIGTTLIVLGGVAAGTGRGRLPGVFAIVFAVITPGISLATYIGVLFSAVTAA